MIQTMKLSQLAEVLQGQFQGPDSSFQRLSIDSRTLPDEALFVALRGPRFDGHDFMADACKKGAKGAMVEAFCALDVGQIKVPDTQKALGLIGQYNRRLAQAKVVGVTGSCGKTTVKEMLFGICKGVGKSYATEGNLNNHFGVPLTLSRIEPDARFVVVEMGASAAHEIGYLSRLAEPDLVLLNNVASAHLEGFGTLDRLADAKGEIILGLKAGGTVILNRDDHYYPRWLELATGYNCISFGMQKTAQVRAEDLVLHTHGSTFTLHLPDARCAVSLKVPGSHHVCNALAAATAAWCLGICACHIVRGLAHFAPIKGRGLRYIGRNDSLVIDESYNANPGSMKAAVDVLASFSGPKILVMGEMAELGSSSQRLHEELGRYAKERGIDCILAIGPLSIHTCQSFGQAGHYFSTKQDLTQFLQGLMVKGSTVLIKGSRSMALEQILEHCR